MGLDTTHDAFQGSYAAFGRWRRVVIRAAGGGMEEPGEVSVRWWSAPLDPVGPGIATLMNASDCEGSFSPAQCAQMARDLTSLLPAIRRLDDGGDGHILRDGGYVAVTERFIAGCLLAADKGEQLEFY